MWWNSWIYELSHWHQDRVNWWVIARCSGLQRLPAHEGRYGGIFDLWCGGQPTPSEAKAGLFSFAIFSLSFNRSVQKILIVQSFIVQTF